MELNVLWIDDMPNEAFMDRAYEKGIVITNKLNVDAGIEEILAPTSSYDAIVLDANCLKHKSDEDSMPEVSALQYALQCLSKKDIMLPWFVYTGGGFEGEAAISYMVKGCERNYDDRDYYKKPLEMNLLFEKILEVVPKMSEYKIKHQYKDLLSWYSNPKELIKILTFLEEKKYNNPEVFNMIRKELDWVMEQCYCCGLLLEPYQGSNLADCSKFLGQDIMEKNNFVPLHIQRCFHSTVSVCNEGSHRLKMDAYVKEGKAPYLVQSTIYEFLSILTWLKTLPATEKDKQILKMKVAYAFADEQSSESDDLKELIKHYKGNIVMVEQDENGICHCGKCMVLNRDAVPFIGKNVKLESITRNTKESRDKYPLFARFNVE